MTFRNRAIRLQMMLNEDELAAIEDWRFRTRMPSRAAAIREIIRRGLTAEGFNLANSTQKSSDYGVVSAPSDDVGLPYGKNGG